ncbi:MAG: YdcF family protein [Candidatus Sulfobium sp.]
MGKYIYEKDALKPADAIVVLAGKEKERVEYGVKLFREDWAKRDRIIMSGGPLVWKFTAAALMKLQAESLGIPGKDILLEEKSATTVQAAQYIRAILYRHGYRSIILVTSPYHSRRAAVIFRKVMGDGVRVICAPVEDSRFRFEGWWKRPGERDMVLREYAKFVRLWVFGVGRNSSMPTPGADQPRGNI